MNGNYGKSAYQHNMARFWKASYDTSKWNSLRGTELARNGLKQCHQQTTYIEMRVTSILVDRSVELQKMHYGR